MVFTVFLQVEAISIHPKFNSSNAVFDIALLWLSKPIKRNKYVHPVCLPEHLKDYVGQLVTISGWGTLSKSRLSSVSFIR